jgi:hypothetical protein
MPVERGPQINLRSALILAFSGLIMVGLLFGLVLWLSNTGGVEVQLGDDEFENLDTSEMAEEIADRGPILFSDVGGGSRDIFLQHLSDELDEGWVAFAARQPGSPRDCVLQWQPGADGEPGTFLDPCDGSTIPADGGDLPSYAVYLEDEGETLVIDINDIRATTTTTAAAAAEPNADALG